MKKYIIVAVGCLGLLVVSLYAATGLSTKPQLGRDLLAKAISFDAKFNPDVDEQFRQLILSAQDLYSPQEFEDFITTEDNDGWNIIMHYVSNGQQDQLIWLFDLLKKVYGNNIKTLFDIVYEKDKFGRTPVYISVMRKQLRMVDTLLKKSQELFGNNKDLFFTFMESPDDLTKWTPLMLAAYLNEYEIMKTILKHEVAVFGQAPERLQRNLRKAYALSDAKGKALIQKYHNFPEQRVRVGQTVTESV